MLHKDEFLRRGAFLCVYFVLAKSSWGACVPGHQFSNTLLITVSVWSLILFDSPLGYFKAKRCKVYWTRSCCVWMCFRKFYLGQSWWVGGPQPSHYSVCQLLTRADPFPSTGTKPSLVRIHFGPIITKDWFLLLWTHSDVSVYLNIHSGEF